MPLVELARIQNSPYPFVTECGNCLFHALRTSIYVLWPLLVLRFLADLVLIQPSPYFFDTECGHCLNDIPKQLHSLFGSWGSPSKVSMASMLFSSYSWACQLNTFDCKHVLDLFVRMCCKHVLPIFSLYSKTDGQTFAWHG